MTTNSETQPSQRELLQLQTNAPGTEVKLNSSEELVERNPMPGTPFECIHVQDKGYFLAMGKYKLSEFKETWGEIYTLLDEEKWNLILKIQEAVMHEHLIHEHKTQTEQ